MNKNIVRILSQEEIVKLEGFYSQNQTNNKIDDDGEKETFSQRNLKNTSNKILLMITVITIVALHCMCGGTVSRYTFIIKIGFI